MEGARPCEEVLASNYLLICAFALTFMELWDTESEVRRHCRSGSGANSLCASECRLATSALDVGGRTESCAASS